MGATAYYLYISNLRSHLARSRSVLKSSLGFSLSEDEGLSSLDLLQLDSFAFSTCEFKGDLFGLLGLLPENGFSLATEALLLCFVSSITDSVSCLFAGLVLGYLMNSVFLQGRAVCSDKLGVVHLQKKESIACSAINDVLHVLTIFKL